MSIEKLDQCKLQTNVINEQCESQKNVLNEQIAVLTDQLDQLNDCQKRKDILYDRIKELDDTKIETVERLTIMMFLVGKLFSFSLISSVCGIINLLISRLLTAFIFENFARNCSPCSTLETARRVPTLVTVFFAFAGLLRFFNSLLWIQLFEFCLPIFIFTIWVINQ